MISRLVALLAGMALLLGMPALAPVSQAHAKPVADPAKPVADPAQVVTVRVATSSSTQGVLEAWQLGPDGFERVRGPLAVYVGEGGVGVASERRSRTPRGVFSLTEAFGRAGDPGTRLPYERVGPSHWWVSDVRSAHYNQMRMCRPGASCGFRQSKSEQLGAINAYEYAIVIDYNRDPVIPGRGSAFFLHVTEGKPTAGCVSMPRSDLRWLLRWLDPADQPAISIGIGASAYGVLG